MKDKKKKLLAVLILCISFLASSTTVTAPIKVKYFEDENSVAISAPLSNRINAIQTRYSNNDIIAILKIENTNLESIVAKTTDNEYYLNHNLNKEDDKVGSTFMDYRNTLTDRKLLIYGHNSQIINTEFHLLENYLNESFYLDHRQIFLETEDSNSTYEIFSVMIVTTDYQHMKLNFTEQEWIQHLQYLKENSLYDTHIDVHEFDQILILQTCYYYPKNSYLLIVAKKK